MYVRSGMSGTGSEVGKQLVISAPSIVGGAATTAATAAGAAGSTWLGMSAAIAVPVIGAAVMGVTLALSLLFNRKGPKQKVATTQIVDAVEPELQNNLDGYLAGPRTRSSQAQALANFDAGWAYVLDNCLIPEMGEPGQRCVRDREAGSTKGYDWFQLYRDPIASDPNVIEDPLFSGGGDVLEALGLPELLPAGTDWKALAVPVALIVAGLLFLPSSGGRG